MRSIATIILGLFVVTILLPLGAICDVAPEPGYKRISINLIVETNEDISDYRFFIKSGADLKEIFVNLVNKRLYRRSAAVRFTGPEHSLPYRPKP
jgi:hypothetical protein